jgi:hypothetical protein
MLKLFTNPLRSLGLFQSKKVNPIDTAEIFSIEVANEYVAAHPKARIDKCSQNIKQLFTDYAALPTREDKMGRSGLALLTKAHVEIALLEQFNGHVGLDDLLHSVKDELSGLTKTIASYAATIAAHNADQNAREAAQALYKLPVIAKNSVASKMLTQQMIRQYA